MTVWVVVDVVVMGVPVERVTVVVVVWDPTVVVFVELLVTVDTEVIIEVVV